MLITRPPNRRPCGARQVAEKSKHYNKTPPPPAQSQTSMGGLSAGAGLSSNISGLQA